MVIQKKKKRKRYNFRETLVIKENDEIINRHDIQDKHR